MKVGELGDEVDVVKVVCYQGEEHVEVVLLQRCREGPMRNGGPGSEQEDDELQVVAQGGDFQRGLIGAVERRDFKALLEDEVLGDRRVALQRGQVQQGAALSVPQMDVGPAVDQRDGSRGVSVHRGGLQRAEPVRIGEVDVRAGKRTGGRSSIGTALIHNR